MEDESETASDELGSNSNGDLNLISLDVCSSGTKLVEGSNSNNVNSNGDLKYFYPFSYQNKKEKKKKKANPFIFDNTWNTGLEDHIT